MKKDIRNLVLVMGVSVLAAFAVTGLFLYHYGPSGRYTAENTLIEPSLLARLNYNDLNPKTGQSDRYVFDKIVYAFWDKTKGEWGELEIPIPIYKTFYGQLLSDISIETPSDEIKGLFSRSYPARLDVKVRTESGTGWQKNSKNLQRVEFAENSDYYRVELNEENAGVHWAYFYHPNVFQETFRLFIP